MKNESPSQQSILEKIVNDSIFASGDYYKEILQYMMDCFEKNYIPTEVDIATKVFGKKDDFNPSEDTLVRVYFYRLRKKLEKYYTSSGQSDPIRLTIPKGHHYLEFTDNTKPVKKRKEKILNLERFFILITFFILIAFIVIQWFYNRKFINTTPSTNKAFKKNFIWSDFVKSEIKTTFAIGELFTFYINNQKYNHEWLIRDDQINSYEDLQEFIRISNLNKTDIYLPGWDIIPKSALSNVIKTCRILPPVKNSIDFKITSEVALDDIRNNNIIFMGHFHNLKHLKNYLPNKRFHPHTRYLLNTRHPERHLRVTASDIDTTYQINFNYGEESALNNDYVVVAKFPGPNNNIFLFIVSFQSMGRLETMNILTDENLYPLLEREILSLIDEIPHYFELLIEVKGFQEEGFQTKVKHIYKLPEKYQLYE